VYRLARGLFLAGFVKNDTQGVAIEVQGQPESIQLFIERLRDRSFQDYPALMDIACIDLETIELEDESSEFRIIQSDSTGQPLSQVTPDCATCPACLKEMISPDDFRCHYPFINCTHCGPRYSIVKTIPYDRPSTTMASFEMCGRCLGEYSNVKDRRFHAQPVACPQCGPQIQLLDAKGTLLESNSDQVIARCADALRNGQIAAVKGIGGFHLAVDATNDQAVQELRKRKRRDAKPFALMASTLGTIGQYAMIDEISKRLLLSPEAPIVLLNKKEPNAIAPSVAFGTNRFGFMLPYAPLHHLLFAQEGIDVLVMTSANLSDQPLICDNAQAIDELGKIVDVFITHNRDIYRQVDDSVVHEVSGRGAFLRRARGYVPTPIYREHSCPKEIFAAGADLKSTFCFVKDNQYLLSEHIGDLADGRVYRHYTNSVEHLRKLFEVEPELVACDLHPGYFSTYFAEQIADIQLIRIQHHWAHIASVLADTHIDGPVIGLVADGTGYGSDGAVWGCECLIASLTDFTRFGHLAYYPLAGGDSASKEAIRPIIGMLTPTGSVQELVEYQDVLSTIEPDADKRRMICVQIQRGLNAVQTSSLGRLFDAAAALIGLGSMNRFEAELPMALESIIQPGIEDSYHAELVKADDQYILRYSPIIAGIIQDIRRSVEKGIIAAKFHNSICDGLLDLAKIARGQTQLNQVALSGGVFCNRYLANRLIERLQDEQFSVLWQKSVPVNDGGISLGQAAIAAKMIEDGKI
jgi:hydrogenase maturation protein HypF